MRVVTLLENRTISDKYIAKHGLSLYIEVDGIKILFDTGVDESFAINAKKMSIAIEDIDILIISHGHYDHGGGLKKFLELNSKANIFISKKAFGDYYKYGKDGEEIYIGIDKLLDFGDRIKYVDNEMDISDSIKIFGNVKGDKLLPFGNKKLFMKSNDNTFTFDKFEHEINLIINENNKNYLFSGCSHRGIVNIINCAKERVKSDIHTVFAGMHISWVDFSNVRDLEYLDNLAKELSNFKVYKYYTCHCTGEESYKYLKKKINKFDEIKTGSIIEL